MELESGQNASVGQNPKQTQANRKAVLESDWSGGRRPKIIHPNPAFCCATLPRTSVPESSARCPPGWLFSKMHTEGLRLHHWASGRSGWKRTVQNTKYRIQILYLCGTCLTRFNVARIDDRGADHCSAVGPPPLPRPPWPDCKLPCMCSPDLNGPHTRTVPLAGNLILWMPFHSVSRSPDRAAVLASKHVGRTRAGWAGIN